MSECQNGKGTNINTQTHTHTHRLEIIFPILIYNECHCAHTKGNGRPDLNLANPKKKNIDAKPKFTYINDMVIFDLASYNIGIGRGFFLFVCYTSITSSLLGGYYHVPVLYCNRIDELFLHSFIFQLNCPFYTAASFQCAQNFCIQSLSNSNQIDIQTNNSRFVYSLHTVLIFFLHF